MSRPFSWPAAAGRAVAGFFAFRPAPGTVVPNLISSAIACATVVICCLIFGPALGTISLLGGFTTFWETGRPLFARIRNGLLVTVCLSASMSAGVLVGPYHWAIVPASVAIVLLASMLYYTFMLTAGPSPVMMFYAAVLGTFFGADQHLGWQIVRITLVAGLITSGLLLIPVILAPRSPERRALAAARQAVAAYQASSEDDASQRSLRNRAYQSVNIAWLTLRSAWPDDRGTAQRTMTAELLQTNRTLASTLLGRLGLTSELRPISADTPLLLGRPSPGFLLRRSFRADSVEWFTSWRMGLAAGVAGVVSELIGIGHPYWSILTGTVVINQWMDRVTATRRAAHRTVGTLIGVGIVWAVSALHPGPWTLVVIVMACMVGQYLTFPRNYAVALMFITPMALLAVEASGTGGTVGSLTFDRFTDTLIGAATAVAVTWATSWYFPRRLVLAQSRRAAEATAAVERINHDGDPFSIDGRKARAALQHELLHHVSVMGRAVADDPRLADLADGEHRVADQGYQALGRAWQAAGGPNR